VGRAAGCAGVQGAGSLASVSNPIFEMPNLLAGKNIRRVVIHEG
jgi:hypothetical protein